MRQQEFRDRFAPSVGGFTCDARVRPVSRICSRFAAYTARSVTQSGFSRVSSDATSDILGCGGGAA